jgi:hypothetical protein
MAQTGYPPGVDDKYETYYPEIEDLGTYRLH